MKIISRSFLILFFFITISIFYLSIFGIETDRFNKQILNNIKNIDEKIEIELKKIKLVLDPFDLKVNIKTIGSKLKKDEKIIEIENIKTQLSLKSLVENKFSIKNLEISTKSLEIKNLISFIRSFKNTPELYVLEKIIKKGFLIADIKLEFDLDGQIRDNYQVKGFIKDTNFNILKKYNFQKLNVLFEYKKDNLSLTDITLLLNDLNFQSKKISIKNDNNKFLITGEINHKKLDINKKNIDLFIKPFLPKIDVKKIKFNSINNFSFLLNEKFKKKNFQFKSQISIKEFLIANQFNLKNFLPNIKQNLNFLDHELSIEYKKDDLFINGNGNILLQDNEDFLSYSIQKKKNIIDFQTLLKTNNNPTKIDLLNFKKNEASIRLDGLKNEKDETLIKNFSINEKKNKMVFKNFIFNNKFEIIKLGSINLDYTDKENKKNQIKLYAKKDQHILEGSSLNTNKLIDNFISDEENSNIFNINRKIEINIDKIFLDKKYYLSNFSGNILVKNKKINKVNLNGNFSDDKKFKFTVNTFDSNKITTLYVDKAESIVKRYKFIRGFEEGLLDFYSSKELEESVSKLKIYDFKLKELPVLTKILTLASLQGIADILTGEGIRFDEFEMNFRNKGNLMTIDEIYAIGPAISILMDGYVEKNKLVSLRGTLVPATTINKFIGSLPVLGKILVGSKTGEGVFGVSFKIKGAPKELETTVNPIKTLTPRFITRTLEKIKKN